MQFRSYAVALAAACLVTGAMAQSVAGNWKGKLTFTSLPKAANPQQQQMMDSQLAMVKKMTINLSLKGDHTYTIGASGMPKGMPENKDNGTWKQSGSKLTLTTAKKENRGPKSQDLVLSKDGKTLTLTLTAPVGPKGNITFKRG